MQITAYQRYRSDIFNYLVNNGKVPNQNDTNSNILRNIVVHLSIELFMQWLLNSQLIYQSANRFQAYGPLASGVFLSKDCETSLDIGRMQQKRPRQFSFSNIFCLKVTKDFYFQF